MGFVKKMVLYEVKNHDRPGDESRFTIPELEGLIQELVRVAKHDGCVPPVEILDRLLKEHYNGELLIRAEDSAHAEVVNNMRPSAGSYTDMEFNLRKGLIYAMTGRTIDAIVCFRKQWGLGLVPAKNMAEIIRDDTRAIEILGVHGILRAVLENEAATEWRRENGFTNQCIEEDRKLYGYEWTPSPDIDSLRDPFDDDPPVPEMKDSEEDTPF